MLSVVAPHVPESTSQLSLRKRTIAPLLPLEPWTEEAGHSSKDLPLVSREWKTGSYTPFLHSLLTKGKSKDQQSRPGTLQQISLTHLGSDEVGHRVWQIELQNALR